MGNQPDSHSTRPSRRAGRCLLSDSGKGSTQALRSAPRRLTLLNFDPSGPGLASGPGLIRPLACVIELARKYFAQYNVKGSAAQFNCSVSIAPPLQTLHKSTPPSGGTMATLLQVRRHYASPMMTEDFNLDSGRRVSIESVSIVNTYGGVLEGDPFFISRNIWERTPEELRRWYGDHVVILKPSEPLLPNYRFVVGLQSSPLPDEARWRHSVVRDTLPLGFRWDFSFVTLCWFQNDMDGHLVERIRQNARGLEWEAHAKNSAH